MPAKVKGKYRYANLSIEVKRYDQLRRQWDMHIKPITDQTFSDWAMTIMEDAVARQTILNDIFPSMHFVGKKKNGGIIIEDHKQLVEVTINKKSILCNVHSGLCEHCLYASMHPLFTD